MSVYWQRTRDGIEAIERSELPTLLAHTGKGGGGQDQFIHASPLQSAGSNGRGHRVDADGAATHLVPIGFHMTQDPIHSNGGTPALGRTSIGMGVMAFATSGLDTPRDDGLAPPVKKNVNGQGTGSGPSVFASTAAGVRRLTPVETERLQGLPDNWTAPPGLDAPDSRRYAAVGDACTVPVVQWIAERLLRYGT